MEPEGESPPEPRVNVEIAGRYMLADRSEHPCTIVEIGTADVALVGPRDGNLDEAVIVYSAPLGRIQGAICSKFRGGFELALTGTWVTLSRFAERFRRLAAQNALSLQPDQRRDLRVKPLDADASAIVAYGSNMEILDLSLSGAGLRTLARPPIGSTIELGQLTARVVRHFDTGIAVEFADSSLDASLSERFHQITSPPETLITGTVAGHRESPTEQILSSIEALTARD